MGDITQVSASLATFVERPGVPANDSVFLLLQFGNGAQTMIQASAVAYRAERGLEFNIALHGEAGTLEVDHVFFGSQVGGTMRGAKNGDPYPQPLPIPHDLLANLDPTAMLDPYFKQSAGPRLFIDAALASQQQRRWVAVASATP